MAKSKNSDDKISFTSLNEEFSNVFEDIMHSIGENPLLGRLYSLFIFYPNSFFNQSDLAEKTNVTVSTISRNLKTLEDWNVINKRFVRKTAKKALIKDKWEYNERKDSAVALIHGVLNKEFGEKVELIHDRRIGLQRVIEHWKKLNEESKQSEEGKNIIRILNTLNQFFTILDEEYDAFLEKLSSRVKGMEKI
ncbi:MAG: hypothetical protein ACFFD4_29000 [Candidatus Odinarchaeota archaeon]